MYIYKKAGFENPDFFIHKTSVFFLLYTTTAFPLGNWFLHIMSLSAATCRH